MKKAALLKPCPFCGGEARLQDQSLGYPHWIYCKECGAKVHGHIIGNEAASIEAWNKRSDTVINGALKLLKPNERQIVSIKVKFEKTLDASIE